MLVQGTASNDTHPDPDVLAGTVRPASARFMGTPRTGPFWDRWLSAYYADRVLVTVKVHRVLTWLDLACAGRRSVAGSPGPPREPGPQAPPRGGVAPRVDAATRLRRLPQGLRTCIVASGHGRTAESDPRQSAVGVLRSPAALARLHSPGSVFAELFDDDVAVQRELKTLDLDDPQALAAQRERFALWAGPERARELVARFVREVPARGAALGEGSCEVSASLGRTLGLSHGAIAALDEVYERYDGRGFPTGRGGKELTLAGRILHLAEQAVLAHYDGGAEAAVAQVARLARAQLDPDLCAAFAANSDVILGPLDGPDMLAAALSCEPHPTASATNDELERACPAFATFADLKGRYLLGHSAHVANLVDRAGTLLGYGDAARARLRTAALMIDIGRVGISSAIWDRAGPLGPAEWERVRLHPYWTERILKRSPILEPLSALAAAHHERLDGSGYHRAASGSELSHGARLLAAADAFAAMTEARAYRAAITVPAAAQALNDEVLTGRLDATAASALIEAAGLPRQRGARPNDLTEREIDVLRSWRADVATGRSLTN